ncbi:MAG: phosphocholine cytidylyltransferase family protein [Deltaproteobacteria bacterium]|nr:phosphocholine cytidylyltransferase family protein [Deltaproteobacteria bacterium]
MGRTLLIPAAGEGTRLRPATLTRPKCLVDVAGVPLLGRQLAVAAGRFDRVVLVTGYREADIRDYVAAAKPPMTVDFVTNADWATTNNTHSLWLGLKALGEGDMVLLDGDLYLPEAAMDRLLGAPGGIKVAVEREHVGEVRLTVDADRRVLTIGKHVPREGAWGESVGLQYFSDRATRGLLEFVEGLVNEGGSGVFYEMAFERMIRAGWEFAAVDATSTPCQEIDTPEDLRRAEELASKEGVR